MINILRCRFSTGSSSIKSSLFHWCLLYILYSNVRSCGLSNCSIKLYCTVLYCTVSAVDINREYEEKWKSYTHDGDVGEYSGETFQQFVEQKFTLTPVIAHGCCIHPTDTLAPSLLLVFYLLSTITDLHCLCRYTDMSGVPLTAWLPHSSTNCT